MSDLIADIAVKFTANADQLAYVTERAKKDLAAFDARAQESGKGLQQLGGLLASMLPAAFVKTAVTAFTSQEKSIEDVRNALSLYGHNVDATLPKMLKLTEEVAKNTAITEAQAQSAISAGLRLGMHADAMDENLKAAIGLNEIMGGKMGLEGSMRLLVQAEAGRTDQLKRHGIIIDDTMSKEQKYKSIVEQATRGYGMAESNTTLLGVSLGQLGKAYTNLKEEVGKLVSEGIDLKGLVKTLTDALNGLAETVKKMPPDLKKIIAWALTLTVVALPAIKVLTMLRSTMLFTGIAERVLQLNRLLTVMASISGLSKTAVALAAIGQAIGVVAIGAGVFAAFYALGKWLDDLFNISDKLANLWNRMFNTDKEDAAAIKNLEDARRAYREASNEGDWKHAPIVEPDIVTPIDLEKKKKDRLAREFANDLAMDRRQALAISDQEKLNVLLMKKEHIWEKIAAIQRKDSGYKTNEEWQKLARELQDVDLAAIQAKQGLKDIYKEGSIGMEEKLISLIEKRANHYEKIDLMQKRIALNARLISEQEAKDMGAGKSSEWFSLKQKELDLMDAKTELEGQTSERTRLATGAVKGSTEAYKVIMGNQNTQAEMGRNTGNTARNTGKIAELMERLSKDLERWTRPASAEPTAAMVGV